MRVADRSAALLIHLYLNRDKEKISDQPTSDPDLLWSNHNYSQCWSSQPKMVKLVIAQAIPSGLKICKVVAFNGEASKCGFVCNFERAVARMLRRGGSWNATHFSQDESHQRQLSVTVSWSCWTTNPPTPTSPKVWNKSGLSGNRETGQKWGVNEAGRAGFHKIKPDWWKVLVTDRVKLFFCEVAQSGH